MGKREAALRDLIELRCPVDEAAAALARFPWDSATPLVVLTRFHALRLLDRFVQGTLSPAECAQWADAIELREDVELEPESNELLRAFLHELSTPELFEPLTRDVAERWKSKLTRAGDA